MSPKNLSDEQLDAEIRELQKQVGNGQ
jgi:hypothetical protein